MNFNELGGSDEPVLDEMPKRQQEPTMPLGIGDVGEDAAMDVLTSAGSYKRFRAGSLVLIVVVACAVAGLFSMRFLARTTASFTAEAEFEEVVDEFFGGAWAKTGSADEQGSADESVLGVLSETYTEYQVPLENVAKNPFIVFETTPLPVASTGNDDQDDRAARERERIWNQQREARKTVLDQSAARLNVKSILMGSNPLANLNNRIVHVGDVVAAGQTGVEFRVISITSDTVTVAAEDSEYELTVEYTLQIHAGS